MYHEGARCWGEKNDRISLPYKFDALWGSAAVVQTLERFICMWKPAIRRSIPRGADILWIDQHGYQHSHHHYVNILQNILIEAPLTPHANSYSFFIMSPPWNFREVDAFWCQVTERMWASLINCSHDQCHKKMASIGRQYAQNNCPTI